MIVRFGFVAMSLLLDDASPSRTMTYKTLSKLDDREAGLLRMEGLAAQNLHNTLRIMKHAASHDIRLYRLSSRLVPLATHQHLADWNPYARLEDDFSRIGDYAREAGMRISFHPDHFCIFSTPRPEVLRGSIADLRHHVRMLEYIGADESAKCNIHMGGTYGDKASAGARFAEQFGALEPRLRHRVTLENDDKTFNVKETLEAAGALGLPMVLDIHHHAVNPGDLGEDELIGDIWPAIDATWRRERERLYGGAAPRIADGSREGLHLLDKRGLLPPKIHASSPKSASDPRGHADYVQAEPLLRFLRGAARTTDYLDCMLEAKAKDAALLQLMRDLGELERQDAGVRVIDGASVEVEPL